MATIDDVLTPQPSVLTRTAPNFVLAGEGRIIAISDVRIWLIDIAKEVRDPGLADRPAAGQRVSFA